MQSRGRRCPAPCPSALGDWQTRTSVEKENSVPIGGWVHAAVICFIKEGLIKSGLPSVQGQIFAPAKSEFPISMWVKCRQNQSL